MKKIITFLMALLTVTFFVSCSKDKEAENVSKREIDTGIPDVVMMIEDDLKEDEYAAISDNRVLYVNDKGNWVEYREWDADGNIVMEKYHSYHNDERLYQELIKRYENGQPSFTQLSQYEYTQDSKEAVVTLWTYDHKLDKLQTDSVVCTMTTEVSDLYCNSTQSDPLKIRGLEEYHYGMRLGHIQFFAGNQVKE